MTRLVILLFAVIVVYWFVRNIVRAFLSGLNPDIEKVRRGGPLRKKDDYKDVQDAEFKDITDEK